MNGANRRASSAGSLTLGEQHDEQLDFDVLRSQSSRGSRHTFPDSVTDEFYARNRLESDLLDAMMCIEDLKQALELRMARDPREAEERRYLIRQNKKLLNQLYESAKKIERLELTKVEMKEQLELLDFQILEVENQKAMMEEELRRLPSCNHSATQTEVGLVCLLFISLARLPLSSGYVVGVIWFNSPILCLLLSLHVILLSESHIFAIFEC
ncbi:unnamed protein product [Echinostoma caproni]|uniref:JAKMIP_CC3 domain-containing protein n=1 Tax=Echinostoma caproni TaxID=27848 RepID=A0A183AXC0_9TREM|nr:unnamed protein product [Echinostoma caproni]